MEIRSSIRKDATIAVGILALAVGIGVIGIGSNLRADLESNHDSRQLAKVRVVELSRETARLFPERFTGVVATARQTELAAKIVGRVREMLVDVGDRVVAGAPLVRLDEAQLRASLALATAELRRQQVILDELVRGPRVQEVERAAARVAELTSVADQRRATLQRFKQLGGGGAISAEDLDNAKFGLRQAEAQLQIAQLQLDELKEGSRPERIKAQQAQVSACQAQLEQFSTQLADATIVAPFDGAVQIRYVDEGAVVSPGQNVVRIVESDQLEVHVGLPPRAATKVASEPERVVHVEVAGACYKAAFARLAPALDSASGTRPAILKIMERPGAGPVPGESAELTIDIRLEGDGWWAPTQALTSLSHGLWCVLVAEPTDVADVYRLEQRPIELLHNHGELTQFQGQFEAGEYVVAAGLHRVVPGQLVRVDRECSTRVEQRE